MSKRRSEVNSDVKKLQKKKSQDSSILEIFRGRPDVMVGILLMICMLSFVVAPAIQTMMDGSNRSGSVDQDALQRSTRNRNLLRRFLAALAEEAYGDESSEAGQISSLQKIQFGMAPDVDPYGLARPLNQNSVGTEQMELNSALAIAHGMAMTDDEAKYYITELAQNVPPEKIQEIFKNEVGTEMSFDNLLDLLKKEIEGIRLMSLVPPSIASTPTPSQAWQYQRDKNRRVTFQLFPVSVSDYLDDVEGDGPSEDEKLELFYSAAGRVQSPNTRGHALLKYPGYQFQYVKFNRSNYTLYANALMRLERDKVTDEEIQEYYDTNINLFVDRSNELDALEEEATNEDGDEASDDPSGDDSEDDSKDNTEDPDDSENADESETDDSDDSNDAENTPEESVNDDGCQEEPAEEESTEDSDTSTDSSDDTKDDAGTETPDTEDNDTSEDAEGSDDSEGDGEGGEEGNDEPKEPEVKYRPLAEVRDQVIDGVLREKASDLATEMFNNDVKEVEVKLKEFLKPYRQEHVKTLEGLDSEIIRTHRSEILAELQGLKKTLTAQVEQIVPSDPPAENTDENSDDASNEAPDSESDDGTDDSGDEPTDSGDSADDSDGETDPSNEADDADGCQEETADDEDSESDSDDTEDSSAEDAASDDAPADDDSSEGEATKETEEPKTELVDRDYVLIEVGETDLLTQATAMEVRTKTADVLLSEGLTKPDWYSLVQYTGGSGGHASQDFVFIREAFKTNQIYRMKTLGGNNPAFASFSDTFLYINVDEQEGRSITNQEEADAALKTDEVQEELKEFWRRDEAFKLAEDYATDLVNKYKELADENPNATLDDLGEGVAGNTFLTESTSMYSMAGGQFGQPQITESDIRRVNPDVPAGQFGSSKVMRDLRFEAQVTGQFGQPQLQNRYTLTNASPPQPVNLRMFRLKKGESVMIPSHDLSTLYVVIVAAEEFGQFESSIQFHNALTSGSRQTGNPSQFNRQPSQVDYNYFLQRHGVDARSLQRISMQEFSGSNSTGATAQ